MICELTSSWGWWGDELDFGLLKKYGPSSRSQLRWGSDMFLKIHSVRDVT